MIINTAQMRPGIVRPRITGGSKKLSRLLRVPMRMPRGMLTIIARPKPTNTRRKGAAHFAEEVSGADDGRHFGEGIEWFRNQGGGKKRLRIHQIRIKVRMDPALKLKSISACLARPGRGLAISVDLEIES